MLREQELLGTPYLKVPESLEPTSGRVLPQLDFETLQQLREAGWSRVGLMVAFVDSDGKVMMLEHNGRDKNGHGALGPLGETSKSAAPIIEQPLETLYRGIQEELGMERPHDLGLWMYQEAGWTINRWPRGTSYPNEFACAISFPVFVPDDVKQHLVSIPHGTEEVRGIGFYSPSEIAAMDSGQLRPGVQQWLGQLDGAGLLDPARFGRLEPLDFSPVYASLLKDIDLQR